MSSATLFGRDHPQIGRIAAVAEGRDAIALSRGGAPKNYAHHDVNEDVAGFLRGSGGSLLVVADGHGGCSAAEIALQQVLGELAPAWTAATPPDEPWADALRRSIGAVHRAILANAARDPSRLKSRSTLACALIRTRESRLHWASLGDSHVFRVAEDGVIECGPERPARLRYLGGPQHTEAEISEQLRCGEQPLAAGSAVVLVTDGLSEPGIGVVDPAASLVALRRQVIGAPSELRPLHTARGLLEHALAAQRRNRAGDNIAGAVHWVD